jgi:hypothetical protein
MFAMPAAVDDTVARTTPSTGLRMRSVRTMSFLFDFPAAIVPSTISFALSGTAIFAPMTSISIFAPRSARATSLATGWP